MSTLDHTAPFRAGDRVRAADIDRKGQPTGTYRTGTALPTSHDDGFVRVQVDGIARPIVFACWRVEALPAELRIGDEDPENLGGYTFLIADRIEASIAQSGLDKAKVAADAGMTAAQLERSLRHERGLFVHEVAFIAAALGVSLLSLLLDASERGCALLLGDAGEAEGVA